MIQNVLTIEEMNAAVGGAVLAIQAGRAELSTDDLDVLIDHLVRTGRHASGDYWLLVEYWLDIFWPEQRSRLALQREAALMAARDTLAEVAAVKLVCDSSQLEQLIIGLRQVAASDTVEYRALLARWRQVFPHDYVREQVIAQLARWQSRKLTFTEDDLLRGMTESCVFYLPSEEASGKREQVELEMDSYYDQQVAAAAKQGLTIRRPARWAIRMEQEAARQERRAQTAARRKEQEANHANFEQGITNTNLANYLIEQANAVAAGGQDSPIAKVGSRHRSQMELALTLSRWQDERLAPEGHFNPTPEGHSDRRIKTLDSDSDSEESTPMREGETEGRQITAALDQLTDRLNEDEDWAVPVSKRESHRRAVRQLYRDHQKDIPLPRFISLFNEASCIAGDKAASEIETTRWAYFVGTLKQRLSGAATTLPASPAENSVHAACLAPSTRGRRLPPPDADCQLAANLRPATNQPSPGGGQGSRCSPPAPELRSSSGDARTLAQGPAPPARGGANRLHCLLQGCFPRPPAAKRCPDRATTPRPSRGC